MGIPMQGKLFTCWQVTPVTKDNLFPKFILSPSQKRHRNDTSIAHGFVLKHKMSAYEQPRYAFFVETEDKLYQKRKKNQVQKTSGPLGRDTGSTFHFVTYTQHSVDRKMPISDRTRQGHTKGVSMPRSSWYTIGQQNREMIRSVVSWQQCQSSSQYLVTTEMPPCAKWWQAWDGFPCKIYMSPTMLATKINLSTSILTGTGGK